jgi:hypothetical protein
MKQSRPSMKKRTAEEGAKFQLSDSPDLDRALIGLPFQPPFSNIVDFCSNDKTQPETSIDLDALSTTLNKGICPNITSSVFLDRTLKQ